MVSAAATAVNDTDEINPINGIGRAGQERVERQVFADGADDVVDRLAPFQLAVGADAFDLIAAVCVGLFAEPAAADDGRVIAFARVCAFLGHWIFSD
jgi:hypothetical protein